MPALQYSDMLGFEDERLNRALTFGHETLRVNDMLMRADLDSDKSLHTSGTESIHRGGGAHQPLFRPATSRLGHDRRGRCSVGSGLGEPGTRGLQTTVR